MQFSRRINFYMWGYVWKQIFAVNCPFHLHPFFIHSSRKKEYERLRALFFLCANLMHDYTHIWMLSCAVCHWVHPQTHTHNFHPPQFFFLMRHRWLLDWWCRFDRFFSSCYLLCCYYLITLQFFNSLLHVACHVLASLYNSCCCDCNLKEEIAGERGNE